MRLTDRYDGSGDPFEGERTVVWRSLPEGALVTKATISVEPRMPPGASQYVETLRFGAREPAFGATIRQAVAAVGATTDGVVEVDFHGRRTAIGFAGITVAVANALSVDIGGGIFLAVGKDGTIPAAPGSVFPFSSGNLPGLTALRLRLDNATLPDDLGRTAIEIATMPSNVTLRFGKLPPFFARNGELAQKATTSDVTAALQRALADAPVSAGYYSVPLVVHSDTPGRLAVTIQVEYLGTAPLLAPGLREVVLPYDFSSVTNTEPSALEVTLPAGAAVLAPQTSLQVRGAFEASRVAQGPTGVTAEGAGLPCSSSQTLAQKLAPAADLSLTGVDLLVAADGPAARLALDIRADADGKPGQRSLLTKPVPFDLAGDASGRKTWTRVPIGPPALLAGGTPVWVIVQAIDGTATLGLDAGVVAPLAGGLQQSADAGFSWRQAGPAGSLLWRLRTVPGKFTMPIDFVAGTGAAARRVSLAAYDPAGKIDAMIDRPEIADAIQGALAATVPAPCAERQLLANPDFSEWSSVGTALGTSDTIELAATEWASVIDTLLDTVTANPSVDQDEPSALAFANDGATLYSLAAGVVTGFDTTRFEPTQLASIADAVALAAAPRGLRLYAVGGSELTAIDLVTGDTSVIDASFTAASGLILVADGGLAFVNDPAGGNIVACDLRTGLVRWRTSISAAAIAVSADGTTLVAADTVQKQLVTFATATGQVGWAAPLPGGRRPVAIAAATQGGGFHAVGAGATDLALISFAANGRAGQSVILPITVGVAESLAMVVTPQGDRIYVGPVALAIDPTGGRLAAGGLAGGASLAVVAVGTRQPSGWTVTAGSATPIEGGSPGQIAAALAPDGSLAGAPQGALSQVVVVSPTCFHELSVSARLIEGMGFLRMARAASATPEAVAELFWLNAAGTALRTDTLAVPPSRLPVTQSLTMTPPPASVQAELRIRVAVGASILGHVTLRMTDAALRSDGWQPDTATRSTIVASDDANAITYRNLGSASAALVQTVALATTGVWALELEAIATANAAGETPAIEIGFRDAAGVALGTAQTFPLAVPGFASAPALLDAPATAASARVRVILPAGTSLQVWRVQLRPRPVASVPCGFIAQSPGSLHVSNARVVYDMIPATAPAPPANGLAPPTPPGANPGDPACADDDNCGDADQTGAQQLAMASSALPAVTPAPVLASIPVVEPPAVVKLTDVAGIGAARARRLQAAGIASAAELAAASPDTVLAALGDAVGVTPALAATLISHARALLLPGSGG